MISSGITIPRRTILLATFLSILVFIYQYSASVGDYGIVSNEFTLSTNVTPVVIDSNTTNSAQINTEDWIALGIFNGTRLSVSPLDVVYSWVNGSDPRHLDLIATWRKTSVREAKHYRDYDELRYSIRSVESMFGKYVSNIIVVSADYERGEHREGQVPQWLNMTWKSNVTGKSRVQMVHHSQVFVGNNDLLPTFNSLAIESQIVNINGLSEQFLYFNDDLFLGTPLLPTDFYTPLFGFVFHTEQHLTVAPFPRKWDGRDPGEWFALERTNYLLSQRFGRRHRVYVSHSTHILSPSILREIASQWKDDFYATASHKFRGDSPEIHTTFMFTHYVIEKHRETLLKAFFFYKMDVNHDNNYDWAERSAILGYLKDGRAPGARRETIPSYKSVLADASLPQPRNTTYTWSASDGFPFLLKSSGPFHIDFYDPNKASPGVRVCEISLEYCFGREFFKRKVKKVSVEDVFMSVAYEKLECGDCITHMLVGLSGEKGVKAFLPKDDVEMDIDYIERVDNLGWNEKERESGMERVKPTTTTKGDINDTIRKGESIREATTESEKSTVENRLMDYVSRESSRLVERSSLTGDDPQESSENTRNNSTAQESSESTESNSTQDTDADSHPTTDTTTDPHSTTDITTDLHPTTDPHPTTGPTTTTDSHPTTDDANTTTTTTALRPLRAHITNMLARYNYVLGQTPFKFYGLGGIYVTKINLNAIKRERPAVFCLNDNLETTVAKTVMTMKRSVTDFLKAYFPKKLPYENTQPGRLWK